MEEVIIWGAAQNGLRLKRELGQHGGFHVYFFCDNNKNKIGSKLDGIDIISFDDIVTLYHDGFNGSIAISLNEPRSVIEQIRNSEIKTKIYITSYEWKHRINKRYDSIGEFLFEIDVNKPQLEYYEYHIAYHCNLKCKGCGHYSNIAVPEFGDLEQYKKDVLRLKELYWGVKRIRLMGGEPLLNVRLPEFCIVTRKVFPDANIRVVTNGLLLPSANNEILDVMREYYIGFDITQYPPTRNIKEKIELRCIEKDVEYILSPIVEKFFCNENIDRESDKTLNYEMCVSKKCHFLENGKMSICGVPILHNKFKDIVNKNWKVLKEDIMDLYEEGLDGFALNDFLSRPIPMCRYCDYSAIVRFEWKGNFPYLIAKEE
mgnify:CR=1 FL=1